MNKLFVSGGVTALALILTGSINSPGIGQDNSDRQFGTVHFATSCNDTAQRRFDRAMRYQHSFWYKQARELFEETLKADPDCTIAYCGIALSRLSNPHSVPNPEDEAPGLAALKKAHAAGAKTQRERDYIESLLVLYTDYDKVSRDARVQSYLKATEQLASRYPDDDEAQINYAITLNVAASPSDKTYANQLKGAAILEPIFARQPQHPGISHYLIHLYDYPPIADRGIDSALRYSKIAPAAPHAQHMPSHIFTRVGYWKESILSNQASSKATRAGKDWDEDMHSMDYMVYAYLQLGRDKEALDVIAQMKETTGYDRPAGDFARAASPARYAIERGDWKAATALEVKPSRFDYPTTISHFARGLGAARSGNLDLARAESAKLAELSGKLNETKNAYWVAQVDIQRQIINAWALKAEGKTDAAQDAMRAAADAEDRTEKSPVTPGPLAPARELYGAMLLELGKPQDALAAFELTMKKEPNRFNGFAGAASAAEQLGDKEKARAYYGRLVALVGEAKSDRPAFIRAAEYLQD